MVDLVTLRTVLQGAGTTKDIAKFLGLIESVDTKVDKLLEVDLKAGLSQLKDAEGSLTEDERKTLLRDARCSFERASHLEKGANQVVALLGLSCCHAWLGDVRNSARALERILHVEPIKQYRVIKQAFINTNNNSSAGIAAFIAIIIAIVLIIINKIFNFWTLDWHLLFLLLFSFIVAIMVSAKIIHHNDRKRLAFEALDAYPEGKAIKQVQLAVSKHLQKPIAWIEN